MYRRRACLPGRGAVLVIRVGCGRGRLRPGPDHRIVAAAMSAANHWRAPILIWTPASGKEKRVIGTRHRSMAIQKTGFYRLLGSAKAKNSATVCRWSPRSAELDTHRRQNRVVVTAPLGLGTTSWWNRSFNSSGDSQRRDPLPNSTGDTATWPGCRPDRRVEELPGWCWLPRPDAHPCPARRYRPVRVRWPDRRRRSGMWCRTG